MYEKLCIPLYAEIHLKCTNVHSPAQKAYFAYSRLEMDIEQGQRVFQHFNGDFCIRNLNF